MVRLLLKKLKLQLLNAEERLQEIKNMRPMQIPQVTPDDEDEEKLGALLTEKSKVSFLEEYDGSEADKALILWVRADAAVSDAMLEEAWARAVEFQTANRPEEPKDEESPDEDPDAPSEEEDEPMEVKHFYVVIKVTASNRELGTKTVWQGLHVYRNDGSFSFQFFDATVPDHMLSETDENDKPDFDYGSGYTWAQLQQMRADQERQIADLQLQIRMAEADYKLKQLEAADGHVYAKFDGTVVSLLSPDEALATSQPLLKVSGGGGFYVEGTVSELQREQLVIGQEVTVSDWYTGMVYTGTIRSVGDFPSQDGYWNGMGNPNSSYYPFTVFVDGSADLQEGRYVSIIFSAGSAQSGIYLENPFLRTEQGRSYVYVQGEDGLLEKRYVTTGKSLWGSYTEILDGITAEDFLAFPYGKDVKEGMPTVEGDLSDLYG